MRLAAMHFKHKDSNRLKNGWEKIYHVNLKLKKLRVIIKNISKIVLKAKSITRKGDAA